MAIDSLWKLCALLFLDSATLSMATTPLVLLFSRQLTPWQVALAGSFASALGSIVQLRVLRWMLAHRRPWMRRFLPAREKLDATLRRYPSASFLALVIVRATPIPDSPLKLAAAVLGYPVFAYFAATLLGSAIYFYALAWLGRAVKLPPWAIAAIAAAFALGFLADLLRRGRTREAA